MSDDLILYVGEDEESKRVEELLQRKGLRYRRVRVDEKLLGWLLVEYGARPPILIAGDKVLQGSEIKKLVEESVVEFKLYKRKGCW